MQHARKSIMQANVICTELDNQDPRIQLGENEYTGTCFHVNPFFLKHLPFYDEEKLFFVTNFHVVDDADNRNISMRTAAMGKSTFSADAEAVVPKLDCANLSICRGDDHPLCFLTEEQQTQVLDNLTMVDMHTERISSKPQKVLTIGFPHCLEEQVSEGCMAGRGSDDDDYLQLNLSINAGNSGGPLMDEQGRVIGVCTSTLSAAEAISFAVPSYSIINYFKKYYHNPVGRRPAWSVEVEIVV